MSPGKWLYLFVAIPVFAVGIAGFIGMAWAAMFKLEEVESHLRGLKTIEDNQFISLKRFSGRCQRIIAISALMSYSRLRKDDPGASDTIRAMPVSLYRWVQYPFNMMTLSIIVTLAMNVLMHYTTVFD